ncbi:uncharacterized protein LOC124888857 [Capsicum annuum]|uniref:uncharacterized protein LOC124888857 n=1 Tax=Capsicum annuum TaxID=4072 RepID=UPI001FB0EB59|nr:uncharacterized protein LOC124888857 [Capsicum annuum]
MAKIKNLSINIPLLVEIQDIPGYAKLMKNLMSKNNLFKGDTMEVTHGCSAIMVSKVAENQEDPRAFTIPCITGTHEFAKSLCDLGASINLMPFVIYKNLELDTPTPTSMRLLMTDRCIKNPVEIFFDVLVKVGRFILPADFVVLDCKMEQEVPIILGLPLAIGRAIIDLDMGEIKLRVQKDKVSFKICKTKKQIVDLQVVSVVNVESERANEEGLDDPPLIWIKKDVVPQR